jgi:hypothetical protein
VSGGVRAICRSVPATGHAIYVHFPRPGQDRGNCVETVERTREGLGEKMNKSWLHVSSGSCLCLLLVILLVGCAKPGPQLYDVSGSVTFDGQPIPKGTVLFQPDESKGCTGSAGIALIRDGKYDTAAEGGTGVVGGPHLVRIVGLDGKPIDSMSPDGIPLFPDYTTTVDLPKANSTQDFAVPKDSKGR